MSNSNGRIGNDPKFSDDIEQVLGIVCKSQSAACVSDAINPWSKHKPVLHTSLGLLTDAQFCGLNNDYGLQILDQSNVRLESTMAIGSERIEKLVLDCAMKYHWAYRKLTDYNLGIIGNRRLGDFRGYNHYATPFMHNNMAQGTSIDITVDSTSKVPIIGVYFSGNDGQSDGSITFDDIKTLNNIVSGMDALANWHIIYVVAETHVTNEDDVFYYGLDTWYGVSEETLGSAMGSDGLHLNVELPSIDDFDQENDFTVWFALCNAAMDRFMPMPLINGSNATKMYVTREYAPSPVPSENFTRVGLAGISYTNLFVSSSFDWLRTQTTYLAGGDYDHQTELHTETQGAGVCAKLTVTTQQAYTGLKQTNFRLTLGGNTFGFKHYVGVYDVAAARWTMVPNNNQQTTFSLTAGRTYEIYVIGGTNDAGTGLFLNAGECQPVAYFYNTLLGRFGSGWYNIISDGNI